MPKLTLTFLECSHFFPIYNTGKVVVSYIPEQVGQADEQDQGEHGSSVPTDQLWVCL